MAFVWFFGRIGVPQAEAFALSVLFVALGVVGNLPGGLLYAFSPRCASMKNGSGSTGSSVLRVRGSFARKSVIWPV